MRRNALFQFWHVILYNTACCFEMSGDVVKRQNMEEVGVRTLAQEPCVPCEAKSQRWPIYVLKLTYVTSLTEVMDVSKLILT